MQELDSFLETLFTAFAAGRKPREAFGDWVARVGLAAVHDAQVGGCIGFIDQITILSHYMIHRCGLCN